VAESQNHRMVGVGRDLKAAVQQEFTFSQLPSHIPSRTEVFWKMIWSLMLIRGKVISQELLRRPSLCSVCVRIGSASSSSQGCFVNSCLSTTNRSPRMPKTSGYVCSEGTVNYCQPMFWAI